MSWLGGKQQTMGEALPNSVSMDDIKLKLLPVAEYTNIMSVFSVTIVRDIFEF